MRQTNFTIGEMKNGFDTMYQSAFKKNEGEGSPERIVIDNKARNELERSHWNHSRSWGKNFAPETQETFYAKSNT